MYEFALRSILQSPNARGRRALSILAAVRQAASAAVVPI